SQRRATPIPCGRRPSTAALTRSGARKASEIVMSPAPWPRATARASRAPTNSTAPAIRATTSEIDMIHVRRAAEHDSPAFEVIVREGKGETRHHVTMSREMCERLTAGKHTPQRYLEAAFRFLLDREPKESMLRRFDVTAISRYCPEFEREMPQYLSQL